MRRESKRFESTAARRLTRASIAVGVAVSIAVSVGGCSMYRLHAPDHPGVADRSAVVWSYAWGLVPGVPEVDCQGQALAEVTVKSHFGFDLLAVVTLGLVSPKKIEWKCAGATPTGGTIPTPTSGGAP